MPRKNDHNAQIIICGRGGQGVLFLTRLLDEAALAAGLSVISSETHGMAMRGGSVASYIRIGDYRSPLIRTGQGDILLAVDEHEVTLNQHLLKPGALVFANSAGRRQRCVDATTLARKAGSPRAANLALLGFASSSPGFPLDYDLLKAVLKKISPVKSLEANLSALAAGREAFYP